MGVHPCQTIRPSSLWIDPSHTSYIVQATVQAVNYRRENYPYQAALPNSRSAQARCSGCGLYRAYPQVLTSWTPAQYVIGTPSGSESYRILQVV